MSSNTGWKLYYHKEQSRTLAECLKDNSDLRNHNPVDIISLPNRNKEPSFGLLPQTVRKLLFFGHPDVILTYYDGKKPERAVFAWEITDAKPATDHWMQRFPSLVGACETGVPSVFITPFEINTWRLEGEFFYAYTRVMEIHQIPIYIANWEANGSTLQEDPTYVGVPLLSSRPMMDTISFLNTIIDYTVHSRNFTGLNGERIIVDLKTDMMRHITAKPEPREYERLCVYDQNGKMKTSDAINLIRSKIGIDPNTINMPERIKNREYSLVFSPYSGRRRKRKETLLDRIEKKNGNPFNGMPLSFDYIFCRLGKTPIERDMNLILDLTELSFSDFAKYHKQIHDDSPLRNKSKPSLDLLPKYSLHLTQGYIHEIKDFMRQYYYAADIILLKDFVIPFY